MIVINLSSTLIIHKNSNETVALFCMEPKNHSRQLDRKLLTKAKHENKKFAYRSIVGSHLRSLVTRPCNMEHAVLFLSVTFAHAHARMFCEKTKLPLEVGHWRYDLKHMDSAVVENKPVSITEGQVYVYDNYFPGYKIQYIHVDNVAIKSCGASATIKTGGVGSSSVLIVLHADPNQEIRSVVDVWGTRAEDPPKKKVLAKAKELKNMKSLYLFDKFSVVHHNKGY